MIRVITEKREIKELHKKFHRKLDRFLCEKVNCSVGFPGGSYKDSVRYSSDLNIWISVQEVDTRFWNGFGLGKPKEDSNNSLVGEINFPYHGINRKIAGAFGVEDDGNVLVLHRGLIGGGKKGIGKKYFTDHFRGEFITAFDGDRESEFCLVGDLNSKHFPTQVGNFVKEIYRIKNMLSDESDSDLKDLSKFVYSYESYGKSVTESNDLHFRDRTHGIIVNALAEKLISLNYKIGSDKNRDLFIHRSRKIKTLFEIKTNVSTQSLYAALGQLLIYSIPIKKPVSLIVVLPNKLNKLVEKRFHSFGIKILYFNWVDNGLKFTNLHNVLGLKTSRN